MTLRTVQNTMKHAHQLLQLLTHRYGSCSPVHISCWEGSLQKVAASTSRCKATVAKLHSRQRELTPLHIAALCGHADVVDFLLQLDADPNLAGVYNYRALHIAASSSPAIVQLLLDAAASPAALTDEADTPLHLACCYQQLPTIRLLLKAAADPSAANNFGVTPLHSAAATAALEECDVREAKAVLLLCSNGADINARDRQGKTPAAVARMAGAAASLVTFLQAGAGSPQLGFLLPGSPSRSSGEASATRVKRWASDLLLEAGQQDLDGHSSEEQRPSYAKELEEENVVLKKTVQQLQCDLMNAQINVQLLRDSLDLQASRAPHPKDMEPRLVDMERRLRQACDRFQAFDEERQSEDLSFLGCAVDAEPPSASLGITWQGWEQAQQPGDSAQSGSDSRLASDGSILMVRGCAVRSPALLASTSILGLAVILLFYFLRRKRSKPAEIPKDGLFDLQLLGRFNGVTGPIFMGVCGKVVNVSSSENITVGEGYGRLWAGRDATFALATLSLKPEDANVLDFTLAQFTDDQRKALAGWYKHFTSKYPVVGRLREYDGWDFSEIEKQAEKETPFGLGKEQKGATAATGPDEPVLLRPGDKVKLQGLDDKLDGKIGVLKKLDAATGKFEVALVDEDSSVLVKPNQISKI
ncbi:ANK3 [Symbiodinium natans]|uniref:ANK3 protein n=1 Tax=Symbiodinium natans TaxID=878477 RepID=A0A812P542_9DINO|nr:ANK3 [Symbiodinium natans]